MRNKETRIIYVTSISGPPPSICSYCRKATSNITAIITVPFYEMVGTEYALVPEMLSIRLNPAESCICTEDALRGVIVEQSL